jgi:hypothetical protein
VSPVKYEIGLYVREDGILRRLSRLLLNARQTLEALCAIGSSVSSGKHGC